MSPAYPTLLETLNDTPLIALQRLDAALPGQVLIKQESRLPGGSIKDRVGHYLVEMAEAEGLISPERSTLIEASSGNSGIALAMVGAVKGYPVIVVMPEQCSLERRVAMLAYGAQVHLTPAAQGMAGACAYAEAYAQKHPDTFLMNQFNNAKNPEIHEKTTGPEIWEATHGRITHFVAAVGTGGTLTGVARYLKAQNPAVKIVAVEPEASAILSGCDAGPHAIQGIGTGFVPQILDTTLIDEIIAVSCEAALRQSREMACKEGLLSGISSGANLHAALQIAAQPSSQGACIVTLQCSLGERYLSTVLFDAHREAALALASS